MTYENNLLAIRLRNNLSQNDMSEILNMNVTVYARYERGERDMPVNVAKRIANEFQTDLNYLCCFEEPYDEETVMLNADVLVREQERDDEKAIERYMLKNEHKRR